MKDIRKRKIKGRQTQWKNLMDKLLNYWQDLDMKITKILKKRAKYQERQKGDNVHATTVDSKERSLAVA